MINVARQNRRRQAGSWHEVLTKNCRNTMTCSLVAVVAACLNPQLPRLVSPAPYSLSLRFLEGCCCFCDESNSLTVDDAHLPPCCLACQLSTASLVGATPSSSEALYSLCLYFLEGGCVCCDLSKSATVYTALSSTRKLFPDSPDAGGGNAVNEMYGSVP